MLLDFFVHNDAVQVELLRFRESVDSEGLPFPLYLDIKWKLLITFVLSLALIFGIRLRLIIVSYLRSTLIKKISLFRLTISRYMIEFGSTTSSYRPTITKIRGFKRKE